MLKPPLTSADSLEDKLQLYTDAGGRPEHRVAYHQYFRTVQEEKRHIYSWQGDVFGPENWREATTKKTLMGL